MVEELLLSIIIPLYNKESSIRNTLDSVLSQSYEDYEIVIVDDGSTDNSVQVVESVSDKRIRLFRKENGGPASARNYGVKMARGNWLLFLDADDTLVMDVLKLVVSNIQRHKWVDVFSYNQYIEFRDKKQLRNTSHVSGYIIFPFISYYINDIFPGPGRTVVKRKAMLEEPFREDLRRHEDTENTFRLMRKYRFYACPQPLFSYNQDTLAASCKRNDYREDFVCMMEPAGKSFFEQMAMFKLYCCETKILYANIAEQIYGNTFRKNRYGRGDKYLKLYKKYKRIFLLIIEKFGYGKQLSGHIL